MIAATVDAVNRPRTLLDPGTQVTAQIHGRTLRDTLAREDISRWEHGRRHPGPWWLRRLATVLQVPMEVRGGSGWIVGGS